MTIEYHTQLSSDINLLREQADKAVSDIQELTESMAYVHRVIDNLQRQINLINRSHRDLGV